jgi:N-acyl-D-amino-acid deacylase
MFDLVIRGGLVVDGSGSAAREADVGVAGGIIVAVAKNLGRGCKEIDAKGMIVTPGFVDIHTHYDAQATWDPYLTPSSLHGVTTAVMGNCGVGFAPAAPDRHEWLIALMESVEDIPGAALTEGMRWGFESFPEYLDVLERIPRVLDLGAQLPHGALRASVMGERGANNEPATLDDIARMQALAEDALRAGALGISTSRTSIHRAANGEPMPGTHADHEECFALARAIRNVGHGVFQGTVEHLDFPCEMEWLGELSRISGGVVSMNLSQTLQAPTLWRDGLGAMARENAKGSQLVAQVAGRAIGIVMGLELTAHPLLSTPTYLELFHAPFAERVAMLRDPNVRARLLADEPLDLGAFPNLITRTFENMFAANEDGTIDYEPSRENSAAAVAARRGVSPREIALEWLMRSEGRGKMYFPLFNYADGNLDVLHTLHQDPLTRMGLSDAGAHCGAICDGGMPTFMLTFWTRDRRGDRLSLEHVVRRQTRETAELYGLRDRGVIAEGMRADINVIDYDALSLGAVEVVNDLPAGGRRLLQRARGYVATICDGVVTVEHDAFTGVLPGKLIRSSPRRGASPRPTGRVGARGASQFQPRLS